MISMNLFGEELEIILRSTEKEGANSPTILFGNGIAHDVHAPQCAAQHCRVLWCGCGLRRILRTHGDRPVHGLVLLLKPSPNRESHLGGFETSGGQFLRVAVGHRALPVTRDDGVRGSALIVIRGLACLP